VPALFIAVYVALFVGALLGQPRLVAIAVAVLGVSYALSFVGRGPSANAHAAPSSRPPTTSDR
jgi:hypothetical protein